MEQTSSLYIVDHEACDHIGDWEERRNVCCTKSEVISFLSMMTGSNTHRINKIIYVDLRMNKVTEMKVILTNSFKLDLEEPKSTSQWDGG